MKNKVEVQPRSVKSSLNKTNRVSEPVCNADVKHTSLNVNSKLICVKCNQCMFDANHDVCFLEFVNDVNVHSKSKSAKRSKKKQTWKPTGKVFTDIGYRWKPIGRTFTIVGNSFPLTRKTKVANLVDLNSEPSCLACSLVSGLRMLQAYDKKLLSAHQLCTQISRWAMLQFLGFTVWKGYDTSLDNFVIQISKFRFASTLATFLQRQSLGYGIEGKSKKHSHKPKAEDSIQEKLYLLHMDLCGPMRIQSINAEPVATACFTQNRSLIRKRHNKTSYELLHNNKPNLSYFYIFGALCYPTNIGEDLGKFKPKADIGIFVGYAPTKKAFQIYNKRTRLIIETIHVTFDELRAMTSEQFSSGPGFHLMTLETLSSGLVPNPPLPTPYAPPNKKDWDTLFYPMFDEYFNPSPSVASPVHVVVAPAPADSTGLPSSTLVD
ncbi:retrovirus-related pol polyprotein from transposon TNT 1-94 [Tanacetum coccineum]